MKKRLSIWMLLTRGTLDKILIILFLMSGLETAVFYGTFRHGQSTGEMALETILNKSRLIWIFILAVIAASVILSHFSSEYSSRIGYTLRRLSVTERQIFYMQSIYNAACCFLMLSVQLFLTLLLCQWYTKTVDAKLVTEQTIYLAAWRSTTLHNMLPMNQSTLWLRNLAILAGYGFLTAAIPLFQRRGKMYMQLLTSVGILLLVIMFFTGDYQNQSSDYKITAIACAFAVFGILSTRGLKEKGDAV